jgi:hypothetical protein
VINADQRGIDFHCTAPRRGLRARRRTRLRATARIRHPRRSDRCSRACLTRPTSSPERAVFPRFLHDIHVQHELADLLLELLGVLRPEQEPVPPLLHLGHGQTVLAGRRMRRPPTVIESRLLGELNSEGSSISVWTRAALGFLRQSDSYAYLLPLGP